jgi:hypothetical protein
MPSFRAPSRSRIVPDIMSSRPQFHILESWLITMGLPIGLVLTLGLVVALLIVKDQWMFAVAIAIAVPIVIVFLRYPFVAIIIWLLVSPFVQITPDYATRYIFWLVHRVMMPPTLVITILRSWINRDKYRLPSLGRAELAAIAFIALVATWIFLERFMIGTRLIYFYDRMIVPFLIYLLVQFTTPREKDLKRLMPILCSRMCHWHHVLVCTGFTPTRMARIAGGAHDRYAQ